MIIEKNNINELIIDSSTDTSFFENKKILLILIDYQKDEELEVQLLYLVILILFLLVQMKEGLIREFSSFCKIYEMEQIVKFLDIN